MKSVKRRRSIGIDIGYINALKSVSIDQFGGKKTITTIASMIFRGDLPAMNSIEERGSSKSISMTEAVWGSIKYRSETAGRSIRKTAMRILNGEDGPLSKFEIERGIDNSKKLELSRMDKLGISRTEELSTVTSSDENSIEFLDRRPRLSVGQSIEIDGSRFENQIEANKDSYGGFFLI